MVYWKNIKRFSKYKKMIKVLKNGLPMEANFKTSTRKDLKTYIKNDK